VCTVIIFLVKYKPINPTFRHLKKTYKKYLLKSSFNNKLFTFFNKNLAGRSSYGLICRTRGKKTKLLSYSYDSFRKNICCWAVIIGFFFSYNLTKYLNLIRYSTGAISVIKNIDSCFIGDFLITPGINIFRLNLTLGYRVLINFVKIRQIFCDIYLPHLNKVIYSKAQGTYSYILYFIETSNLVAIKLATQKTIYISDKTIVTLGRPSGKYHKFEKYGKAGFNKILGYKSIVRGVAKNPVDHPHGGRTKSNCPEVSP
jgi:large subunit ribosomal protein L2